MKADVKFNKGKAKFSKGMHQLFEQLDNDGGLRAKIYLGENALVVESVHEDNERHFCSLPFSEVASAGFRLTKPKKSKSKK